MGAGASTDFKIEVTNLINTSKINTGKICSTALEKIWELLRKDDEYKLALIDSELLHICNIILQNENDKYDSTNIRFALRIVTSFSTLHRLKVKVAKELNLNENVLKYAKDNDNITRSNSQTFFRNLCTMEESSIIVQNMSIPFIYSYVSNLSSTDYDLKHATFILCRNICNFLQPQYLEHLIKSEVTTINLKTLKTYGSNPTNWENRNQIPNTILYFLLNLSFYDESAEVIKANDGVDMIEKLINTDAGESLIAALIISALIGKDESNKQKASLLQSHPKLTVSLMDTFQAALDGGVGATYTKLNNQWGYNWNFFSLHLIVGAIRNLSLSDSNKSTLVANKSLLSMLIKTLNKYINNEQQISKTLESGIDNKIGGGGDDHRSAAIVLESLVSLSYYYEGDVELKEKYMLPSLGIESLLEKLLELPSDRKVPDQSKRYASILLKRITSKPIVIEHTIEPTIITNNTCTTTTNSPSSSKVDSIRPSSTALILPKKHIMISYAWASNKPYVLQLTKALRHVGYDVWRDEEGSNIVPKLAGDIEASLATAIDYAHVVIICISKQYKESINCRSEAQYCKLKNKKVLYVMMNESYHTRSSPESLDGWLAFMLGGDLWYPLWNEHVISNTVNELINLIGMEYNINTTISSIEDVIPSIYPTTTTTPPNNVVVGTKTNDSVKSDIDYDRAWNIINDSIHIVALKEYLASLGVDAAKYLEGLEITELAEISSHLPVAKKRLFNKTMNLY